MNYPTKHQIEVAHHIDLARWARYLKSPGFRACGTPEFAKVFEEENELLDLILARFNEFGGWNPALSKAVGW